MVHHQSIKEPVLSLWYERATFHRVASGYKFNIMNITLFPYLPSAYFFTLFFDTCFSLYIILYFVVVCTFAFASQPLTITFLAFSVLHCNTVFAVVRFLVPFHLHILYLTLVSNLFEFLFQTF